MKIKKEENIQSISAVKGHNHAKSARISLPIPGGQVLERKLFQSLAVALRLKDDIVRVTICVWVLPIAWAY